MSAAPERVDMSRRGLMRIALVAGGAMATDPSESYSMIESEPANASEREAIVASWDAEMDRNVRGWREGV